MLIGKLINALFPKRCPICDEVILSREWVCPDCRKKIKPISVDTCRKCGKPLADSGSIYCASCEGKFQYYDRGYSVFEYKDMAKSLYRFKYGGRAEYAGFYAKCADIHLGDILRELKAEALIPVPIHKKRERKRGYNQAECFACELSKYLGVPVISDYVIRQKNTRALKTLNASERERNLKKAFIIGANGVKLKTIIIVDYIYTTGATINCISEKCREAGVENIYFLTVAIGQDYSRRAYERKKL